ncbi:MAG: HPr family phosphocarrier protein [Oscillospiraceae bacterium]|jgi:phosphotransferase system HPr-like phosphotransfer protein|nr:HPr family phosphocarrier protein [Oscillospiraceae bacterium]
MVFKIKINNSEEAQRLNSIAQQYAFDIWVHGKTGQVDAKSILGLVLFSLETELELVIDDAADSKRFEKDLEPFLAK